MLSPKQIVVIQLKEDIERMMLHLSQLNLVLPKFVHKVCIKWWGSQTLGDKVGFLQTFAHILKLTHTQ